VGPLTARNGTANERVLEWQVQSRRRSRDEDQRTVGAFAQMASSALPHAHERRHKTSLRLDLSVVLDAECGPALKGLRANPAPARALPANRNCGMRGSAGQILLLPCRSRWRLAEPCFPCFVLENLRKNGPAVPEENDQRPSGEDAWRLQLLIDSVIDYAIYMIDPDGRVASWNSGATRLKGDRPSSRERSRPPQLHG
jgi:hypothetical protein